MKVNVGTVSSNVSVVGASAALSEPVLDRIVEAVLDRLERERRRQDRLEGERRLVPGVLSERSGLGGDR